MAQPLGPARKEDVDVARLREWIDYDPIAGTFKWKKDRKRQRAGDPAGCKTPHGYWQIAFDRRVWPAHKLAWVMHYGVWPEKQLDHKNRDGMDNRIENLREATLVQQQANKWVPSQSSTGVKGVTRTRCRTKYHAKIRIRGKVLHLGTFATATEAGAAYKKAAREHFGEFATFEEPV